MKKDGYPEPKRTETKHYKPETILRLQSYLESGEVDEAKELVRRMLDESLEIENWKRLNQAWRLYQESEPGSERELELLTRYKEWKDAQL